MYMTDSSYVFQVILVCLFAFNSLDSVVYIFIYIYTVTTLYQLLNFKDLKIKT